MMAVCGASEGRARGGGVRGGYSSQYWAHALMWQPLLAKSVAVAAGQRDSGQSLSETCQSWIVAKQVRTVRGRAAGIEFPEALSEQQHAEGRDCNAIAERGVGESCGGIALAATQLSAAAWQSRRGAIASRIHCTRIKRVRMIVVQRARAHARNNAAP